MAENRFGQFQRIEMMIGRPRVERLHRSFVVVAGLGAVGGFALEVLARAGIGRFRLVDCDSVSPSNINRQILADWETVGQRKTKVAETRVRRIYPDCRIETLDLLINAESIPRLFDFGSDRPDLIIDAIDSLAPKTELLVASLAEKIPVLSSMGAALRTDPDQIRFGPLTEVTHCRLSALLRKRLRRRGVDTDAIPCVYSTEPVRDETLAGKLGDAILPPEVSEDDRRLHGRRRSTLGSLPTLTGIFGLRLGHEAIRFLVDGEKNESKNEE